MTSHNELNLFLKRGRCGRETQEGALRPWESQPNETADSSLGACIRLRTIMARPGPSFNQPDQLLNVSGFPRPWASGYNDSARLSNRSDTPYTKA